LKQGELKGSGVLRTSMEES